MKLSISKKKFRKLTNSSKIWIFWKNLSANSRRKKYSKFSLQKEVSSSKFHFWEISEFCLGKVRSAILKFKGRKYQIFILRFHLRLKGNWCYEIWIIIWIRVLGCIRSCFWRRSFIWDLGVGWGLDRWSFMWRGLILVLWVRREVGRIKKILTVVFTIYKSAQCSAALITQFSTGMVEQNVQNFSDLIYIFFFEENS